MIKNYILIALLGISFGVFSQKKEFEGYQFKNLIKLDASEIKNQQKTGTCWSFSTSSFLESELIRMGKEQVNLSEMYHVHQTYLKKADNYVRRHGKTQFGEGSLNHDVIKVIEEFGVVPESAYTGKLGGKLNHQELVAVLKATLNAVIKNPNRKLSPSWKKSFEGTLEAYMGELPTSFEVEGKNFTPITYRNHLGLNPSNYVTLTSFTHHPFYKQFILEVPDNWSNGIYHNLPLNEMIEALDHALENGYTVAWDADVSERTWSSKKGIAIVPEMPYSEMNADEKKQLFEKVIPELNITQEIRQQAFDDYSTTDDHLMHIVGKAKDQHGNFYYLVKNSWGTKRGFEGYYYISTAYMQLKTIGFMLHKDALTKATRSKLNL